MAIDEAAVQSMAQRLAELQPVDVSEVESPARQMHPNSLANLRPLQPGETLLNPHNTRGPLVTPAMRKLAAMDYGTLLAMDPARLNMAERIARQVLLDAAETALQPFVGGNVAKSREQVLARLDGEPEKNQGPNTAIQVNYYITPPPETMRITQGITQRDSDNSPPLDDNGTQPDVEPLA